MRKHFLNGLKRGTITMETTNKEQGNVANPAKREQRFPDKVSDATIATNPQVKKGNVAIEKNVLLIRTDAKLPKSIKEKLRKLGGIWQEAYGAYAILLEKKDTAEEILFPWKEKISYSLGYVDPYHFTSEGRIEGKRGLRL